MDIVPIPNPINAISEGQIEQLGGASVNPVGYHTHNGIDSPELDFPTTEPGGNDTELQYNNNGVFDGIPTAVYDNETKDLTLAAGTNPDLLAGGNLQLLAGDTDFDGGAGGDVDITAGSATNNAGDGGNVLIQAGDAADSNHAGGNVEIRSGASGGTDTQGDVLIIPVGDDDETDLGLHGRIATGTPNVAVTSRYFVSKTFNSFGTLTLATIPLPPGPQSGELNPHLIIASLTGQSLGSKAAAYIRKATYARDGSSAPQLIGSIQTDYTAETTAGWDATFAISSNNINLNITTDESPTYWAVEITIIKFASY